MSVEVASHGDGIVNQGRGEKGRGLVLVGLLGAALTISGTLEDRAPRIPCGLSNAQAVCRQGVESKCAVIEREAATLTNPEDLEALAVAQGICEEIRNSAVTCMTDYCNAELELEAIMESFGW